MTVEELKEEKALFQKSLEDMLKHFKEKTGVTDARVTGVAREGYSTLGNGQRMKCDIYEINLTIEI